MVQRNITKNVFISERKSSLKVKIFTNSIVIRNLNVFKAIISSICLMAFKVFSIITEVPLK